MSKTVLLLLLAGRLGAGNMDAQHAPPRCICEGYYDSARLVRIAELALVDGRISSPYGWRLHPVFKKIAFHGGVDIAAPLGTPVHAGADGVIEQARWHYGKAGNWLLVRYGRDIEVGYSHLMAFAPGIRAGIHVHRGELLAWVGNTGLSTGRHVDVRLYVRGQRVRPDCVCMQAPAKREVL